VNRVEVIKFFVTLDFDLWPRKLFVVFRPDATPAVWEISIRHAANTVTASLSLSRVVVRFVPIQSNAVDYIRILTLLQILAITSQFNFTLQQRLPETESASSLTDWLTFLGLHNQLINTMSSSNYDEHASSVAGKDYQQTVRSEGCIYSLCRLYF